MNEERSLDIPAAKGDVIEIHQVFEMEEFPREVQKAAASPVIKAQARNTKSPEGSAGALRGFTGVIT